MFVMSLDLKDKLIT